MVGKFYVPVDFVVMEMEEDKEIPIILGRPFFKTARTLIDVEKGTLTLWIGDEKVEFNLNRAMKYLSEPSELETCYTINVVDQSVKEQSREDYGKSFKNYPDYLSELHEKKTAQEKACAAEAKPDTLEDLTHGPHTSHTDRTPAQPEQPTPEPKLLPANLSFLEKLKALQMVIQSIIMRAQQSVIGDLIEKVTGTTPATCEVRTSPVDHHTVRTDFHTVRTLQKWALLPDPPDPPLTNQ